MLELTNVLPCYSFYGVVDGSMRNAVFSSKIASTESPSFDVMDFPNFANYLVREFCSSLFFSDRTFESFIEHIYGIIFCISKPKMVRSYAGTIIWKWGAIMENPFSFRDRAIVDNPRNLGCFSAPNTFPCIEQSVTTPQSSSPNPAMGGFINVFPESLFHWDSFKCAIAGHAPNSLFPWCPCSAIFALPVEVLFFHKPIVSNFETEKS